MSVVLRLAIVCHDVLRSVRLAERPPCGRSEDEFVGEVAPSAGVGADGATLVPTGNSRSPLPELAGAPTANVDDAGVCGAHRLLPDANAACGPDQLPGVAGAGVAALAADAEADSVGKRTWAVEPGDGVGMPVSRAGQPSGPARMALRRP